MVSSMIRSLGTRLPRVTSRLPKKPLNPEQQRVNWVSQEKLKEIADQNYQRKLNEALEAYEKQKNPS